MKKPHKKKIIFAVILVVVIGASATTAVLLSQYLATVNQPAVAPVTTPKKKLPAEEKADTADKLAFEGNLSGGVEALDTAIEDTSDPHSKFIYNSRKATLLLNNRDLAGALTAAIAAYEIEKTSDSAAFVGQVAREKGDKAMAIEYYKKAIPLIDPEDPFADEDQEYYQSIVTELERT